MLAISNSVSAAATASGSGPERSNSGEVFTDASAPFGHDIPEMLAQAVGQNDEATTACTIPDACGASEITTKTHRNPATIR